jgi:hypothetical protein
VPRERLLAVVDVSGLNPIAIGSVWVTHLRPRAEIYDVGRSIGAGWGLPHDDTG